MSDISGEKKDHDEAFPRYLFNYLFVLYLKTYSLEDNCIYIECNIEILLLAVGSHFFSPSLKFYRVIYHLYIHKNKRSIFLLDQSNLCN